jgi:nucleoside-diphosphate-sugar epimerase
MKILVTGATGYVGRELAIALANQGNQVHILVRNPFSQNIPRHENIILFPGDITDRGSIRNAMKGCTQVYHTAAIVKIFARDPSVFYNVNVKGTHNLLAEALDLGVKKFVYTSTCGVLGSSVQYPKKETDPRTESFDNDYEFTKYLGENLVKEYAHKGLFTVIVSLSKVFGPGIETHSISVNQVINKFIKGKLTFVPKPGSIVANYCFIHDIVDGHMQAMQYGLGGEKYILGGENISYNTFFKELRSLSGSKAKLIHVPQFIVKGLAFLDWCKYLFTKKEPFVTVKGIHHIFINKEYDNKKAIQNLHYQPTPFTEALKQTIHFLKNQHYAKQ